MHLGSAIQAVVPRLVLLQVTCALREIFGHRYSYIGALFDAAFCQSNAELWNGASVILGMHPDEAAHGWFLGDFHVASSLAHELE